MVVILGSVRGRLERLSDNTFRLFPARGPAIDCIVCELLHPKIREAHGKMVTLSGRLFYRNESPSQIEVQNIQVHHESDQSPKLSALCGVLKGRLDPNFQDKPSEQIVREIRDA